MQTKVYEGPYLKCPLCGNSFPAKTKKGYRRYFCGECWYSALGELVLRVVLQRQLASADRQAEMERWVVGTRFENLEEVQTPTPTSRPTPESRLDAICAHLQSIEPRGLTTAALDAALHMKKGTAAKALRQLEAESAVASRPEGRRTIWYRC